MNKLEGLWVSENCTQIGGSPGTRELCVNQYFTSSSLLKITTRSALVPNTVNM